MFFFSQSFCLVPKLNAIQTSPSTWIQNKKFPLELFVTKKCVPVDTRANYLNESADLKRKKENDTITATRLVLISSSFHPNVFFSFLFQLSSGDILQEPGYLALKESFFCVHELKGAPRKALCVWTQRNTICKVLTATLYTKVLIEQILQS